MEVLGRVNGYSTNAGHLHGSPPLDPLPASLLPLQYRPASISNSRKFSILIFTLSFPGAFKVLEKTLVVLWCTAERFRVAGYLADGMFLGLMAFGSNW